MTSRPATAILLLVAGFGIWGVTFNLLYGLQALGCAAGWDGAHVGSVSMLRVALTGAYVLHLAAFGGLLAFQVTLLRKPAEGNVRRLLEIGLWLTIAATLASGFTAMPAVVLRACTGGPLV